MTARGRSRSRDTLCAAIFRHFSNKVRLSLAPITKSLQRYFPTVSPFTIARKEICDCLWVTINRKPFLRLFRRWKETGSFIVDCRHLIAYEERSKGRGKRVPRTTHRRRNSARKAGKENLISWSKGKGKRVPRTTHRRRNSPKKSRKKNQCLKMPRKKSNDYARWIISN